MTTYNTSGDAPNTAVRSLLTKIGEYYLQKSFNTSSGYGKHEWNRIKNEVFGNRCAYCNGINQKLQIEHLIMFNRTEYGLHHPGNVVPSCSDCNKRHKKNKEYVTWQEQLRRICKEKNQENQYEIRLKKLINTLKMKIIQNYLKKKRVQLK